jgi:hypothetical protein
LGKSWVYPEYTVQGSLPQLADDSCPDLHFAVNVSEALPLVLAAAPTHFEWVGFWWAGAPSSEVAPAKGSMPWTAPGDRAGTQKLLCLHGLSGEDTPPCLAVYSSYADSTLASPLPSAGACGLACAALTRTAPCIILPSIHLVTSTVSVDA